MSDSAGWGGGRSASEAQPPEDPADSLRWSGTAAEVAAVAAQDVAGAVEVEAEDEPPEAGACGMTRVDSLTLALKAIHAAGLHYAQTMDLSSDRQSSLNGRYSQDNAANSGNSLDSSGSGSHLEEDTRPTCKRASSLKLPSRQNEDSSPDSATKKAVRFADAMGLDLALVRHVFDLESPPEIPPQATRDLVLPPSDDEEQEEEGANLGYRELPQQQQAPVSLYLSPSFAQPGSAPNFNSRITAQKVVLERAQFHQQTAAFVVGEKQSASAGAAASIVGGQVRGYVRVANLGFEKSVRIRASLDNWSSSFDVCADYVAGSGGGGSSDQFYFVMSLPEWLRAGDRIAFCVAYSVNGETYWDNNFGDNYAFHCVPVGSASGRRPGLDQAWSRYV